MPAAKNPKTGITAQQEEFCQFLANNPQLTYSDAYRYAYATGNMKNATINRNASSLLDNSKMTTRVDQLKNERAIRTGVSADALLVQLDDMRTADVSDIIDSQGKLIALKQWPKVWRLMLNGFDSIEMLSKGGESSAVLKKVKWIDRLKVIELIGKHIGVQAFQGKFDVKVGPKKSLQELLIQAAAEGQCEKNH